MVKVSTHEAKTHLSRLLADVEQGQHILILRGKQPAAQLVPVTDNQRKRRRPHAGKPSSAPVIYTADAFDPLTPQEMEKMGFS